MYKATRDFIKARLKHAYYVVEVVAVKQVGSGIPNECFANATNGEVLRAGNKVVSGWVVQALDKADNSTAIVQHWWNVDSRGRFFDLTPGIGKGAEYVMDMEILEFGQAHYGRLDNLVAPSLLYKNKEFFTVERIDGDLVSHPIPSLSVNHIFRLHAPSK